MAASPAPFASSGTPPAPAPGRRAAALSAAVLLAATAVPLWPALARGEVLFRRDVHLMWYAQVEALVRAVARGEWPLWNADIGFGQPLWADGNVQVLYPLTWLNLVLRPWRYYTLFVVVHLLLAGLGARALARVLGLGGTAATAAGLLWVLSGPMLSLAEIWNQLAGAAWMPWALAAAARTLESGDRRFAVGWGAAGAAQVLAGSPEAFLLSWAGAAALFAVRRPRAAPVRRILPAAALAAGLGLGLSAGQSLPSLAAAADSGRVGLSAQERGHWSVHPLALPQLLLPLALDELPLRAEAAALAFGGPGALLPSLYLGLAGASLAGAAFAGERRRGAAWLLAAFAATVALALGRHLGMHELLAAAPLVGALRYPVKAMMAASLCWSLLCGLGVEAWLRAPAAPRRRLVWVLISAGALAAAGTAAAVAAGAWAEPLAAALLPPGPAGTAPARLAPARGELAAGAAAAAVAALLAALRARAAPPLPPLALGVVALAAADLLAAHHDLVATAPVSLFTHRPAALEAARPPGHGRLYSYDYNVPGRGALHLGRPRPFAVERAPEGWPLAAATALSMRLSLFPPSAAPWGVAGSFDHDIPRIAPRWSGLLFEAVLRLEGTPAQRRLLGLGGVSRVAVLHERGFESLPLLATADTLLPEPLRVLAVPGALGRAYAVGAARVVPDDAQALATLLDPAWTPGREVVLAEGAARAGPADARGRVNVEHVGADGVRLRAELEGPGLVVLNDAWSRGWTARVDGKEVPVRRANVAWRAVEVGAGAHEVELRFWPPGLSLGLAVSAGSLLAAALLTRRAAAGGPA